MEEGIIELKGDTELSQRMDAIVRILDALSVGKPVNAANAFPVESCYVCASPMHQAQNCPSMTVFAEMEQLNTFNNFQKPSNGPYSETYNLGWRNHLNFSWKQNQPTTNQGGVPRPPNHYPQDFLLLIKIMDAQLRQRHYHLSKPPLKSKLHQYSHWKRP
jgi:hypothetical protein